MSSRLAQTPRVDPESANAKSVRIPGPTSIGEATGGTRSTSRSVSEVSQRSRTHPASMPASEKSSLRRKHLVEPLYPQDMEDEMTSSRARFAHGSTLRGDRGHISSKSLQGDGLGYDLEHSSPRDGLDYDLVHSSQRDGLDTRHEHSSRRDGLGYDLEHSSRRHEDMSESQDSNADSGGDRPYSVPQPRYHEWWPSRSHGDRPYGGDLRDDSPFRKRDYNSSRRRSSHARDHSPVGARGHQPEVSGLLNADVVQQIASVLEPVLSSKLELRLEQIFKQASKPDQESPPVPVRGITAPPSLVPTVALEDPSTHNLPGPSGLSSYRERVRDGLDGVGNVGDSASTSESDEEPHLGDSLSRDFLSSLAQTLSWHLDFQVQAEESKGKQKKKSLSKLSSSNPLPPEEDAPLMSVDSMCKEQIELLASMKRVKPGVKAADSIPFQEEEIKELFTSPSFSEETSNKVRVESQFTSGPRTFRDPIREKVESDWSFADVAARTGLKTFFSFHYWYRSL